MNNLNVYPEIIASTIKENELDLYLIWAFSKKKDISGNGIIEISEIINIACALMNLKSNYVYNKIHNGVDKYWGKIFIKNKKRYTCLFSLKKIINRLKPDLRKCKPFIIPMAFFNKPNISSKYLKNTFISLIAGRYEDGRPVSIEALINNMGLSESTIRNAIKESEVVETRSNYREIKDLTLLQLLESKQFNQKVVIRDGKHVLIQQLPNSYHIDCFARLPFKLRPKELKVNDRLLDNFVEKKYHSVDNQIMVNNQIILSSYNR